ncbi:hypothetical protein ACFP56_03715 [Paenibacillus septentrionalis]|uniref:Uncharacterized protein n=1 Tax=Paenibacillus septentrionalis TaxID=429342 RepID=A0ABW1V204_9BACL
MEIVSSAGARNQLRTIELPLLIEVQLFGFQDQEDWPLVEIEERSVRFWYVSYNVFAENILRKHCPSVAFHIRCRVYVNALLRNQLRTIELPLPIEVQLFGFQDQEDWPLVEIEERSVRFWYVSTGVFASVQASMSNPLHRMHIVIKVV